MEGDRWPVSPGRGSPNFPVTIFRGSYGSAILKRKERASAGEDACPPGSRGWAIAQRPARPGGRSARGRDDGREGHGQTFPPINGLVDLDVHLLADRRHAVPGRVDARDIGRTLHGARAQTEDPVVTPGLATLADRLGAADDGVQSGRNGAAQLERNHAIRVGDVEAGGTQVGELRTFRRRVHRVAAELSQRAVNLAEQQEPAEGATLTQTAAALRALARGHPGGPLRFRERPPTSGHAAEDVANRHLRRGSRVAGDGESAAELAERAGLRDVQATFS